MNVAICFEHDRIPTSPAPVRLWNTTKSTRPPCPPPLTPRVCHSPVTLSLTGTCPPRPTPHPPHSSALTPDLFGARHLSRLVSIGIYNPRSRAFCLHLEPTAVPLSFHSLFIGYGTRFPLSRPQRRFPPPPLPNSLRRSLPGPGLRLAPDLKTFTCLTRATRPLRTRHISPPDTPHPHAPRAVQQGCSQFRLRLDVLD